MKLEIYQVGKVPPLTVVECNDWQLCVFDNIPTLQCIANNRVVALFNLNNIAGFKKRSDNNAE